MARTKSAVLTPPTYEEAQKLLGEYATKDARKVELQAQLDQKITDLREQFAPELNELVNTQGELMTRIQLFAETNRDSFFAKKKSLDLQHGIIGFRIGNPKLKGIPRKEDALDKIINYLKQYLPDYARTKTEINKELLIANREKAEIVTHMRTLGLSVEQDESFFIELKKEEIAN